MMGNANYGQLAAVDATGAAVVPLASASLAGLFFWLTREDGSHRVGPMVLHEDGTVSGNVHANESGWRVIDGMLSFIGRDGRPTTVFTRCVNDQGRLKFEGRFVLRPELNIVHHLQQSDFDAVPEFETPASVASFLAIPARRYGWSIGAHSFGKPDVLEKTSAKLIIGKFSTFAEGVIIALGNHNIDGATSYPFSTLKKFWPSLEGMDVDDHSSKGDVIIGNDVTVSCRVTILSGVEIGNGALIMANSLVNKSVPPYAIVAGNPAKVVGYRQSPETIEKLQAIAWWNWDDETLNERLPLMLTDMNGFIEMYGA